MLFLYLGLDSKVKICFRACIIIMISIVVNKDRKRLMLDLAAYVAEHLPAIPALKQDRIMLDELAHIDVEEVCSTIRSFMSMRRVNYSMYVDHPRREVTLYIEGSSNEESKDANNTYKAQGLLICPHCNYTTEYADILSIHIRAHYI